MQRGKRGIRILLFVLTLVFGCAGSILALSEKSISSRVETGGVDLVLQPKMIEGKKKVPFVPPQTVVPGQKISMIPVVVNQAEACYVRLEVTIRMKGQARQAVTIKDFYGFNQNWIKQGSYYYLVQPLEHGQAAELYQGIKVPPFRTELADFCVEIHAEAIQAENLGPDFSRSSPWGSVETEVSEIGAGYSIGTSKAEQERGISLIYEGGIKALIAKPEEFLTRLNGIMPGDTYSDTMKLENTTGEKIRIFFRAEAEESALLRHIKLIISRKNTRLYEGPLYGANLSDYQILAEMDDKETQELVFSLYVPKELRNPYQQIKDRISWHFMVQDMDGNAVQTGDCSDGALRLLFFLAAGGSAAAFLLVKRGS